MKRDPIKIMSIAGTRPEAIKFAPLVRALLSRAGIEHVLVATGQHGAMFHEALDPFGVIADIDLALPNVGMADFCARLTDALAGVFASFAPDLVLVQGDTSTAWTAAKAAHAAGIGVGHVEAGLRTDDPNLPWPEERNRREIDAISALLFAPSAAAASNLIGLPGRVHITGNTGIDAMQWMLAKAPPRLRRTVPVTARRVLVTCHRRESIAQIPALMSALRRLAGRRDVHIHMPVHPNPAVAAMVLRSANVSPHIVIERAMPYPALLAMLQDAYLLLTDSGGLQEEAATLGLPTLVLRRNTERPEPIESGSAMLVGMDEERIVAEAGRLLDDRIAHARMARPSFPYGRGDAADRIADAIAAWAAEPVEVGGAFP